MSRRPYKRSADPDVAQLQDVAQAQADATISPSSAPGLLTAVATVGDLRRTPGDVNNQRGPAAIYLAGTLTPMDGGQGAYVWMPGSTIADDNDTTVAVAGTVRGRWSKVPAVTPYDVLADAAFSAVSSISTSWTAGKYRRLEAHLRVDSGSANGYMSFLGLTGETYSRTGFYANPSAVFTNFAGGPSGTAWIAQGVGNQVCTVDVDVSCAASSQKMFRADIADAGGYQAFLAGTCSDATAPVTGLLLTFTGATAGWFELLGFA